ncbi:MAG TPA: PilT/PilU family type 4a pilus ATPase [Pyrinomonadaceae bacterium]|nr:PilT/PilU family type 4a pilus ATPase [Pyrinomonadaceae bacterium]
MDRLFQLMKEKNASDMFFAVNSPVHIKINGNLIPINQQKLEPENILSLLAEIATPEQMQELEVDNELNMGISVANLGRFRLSAFRQRGSVSAVFRFVPANIPALGDLGLPPVLSDLIMEKRGLLLLVGATGSGKSTTLAAMIDCINSTRSGHIVTIEDPIEFLHRDKHAFVTQREVDVDTRSFAEALRGALRQDPDVILVGEMRDHETIETALTAAETGHLVLSTLHTLDATETITRIVSSFPSHQQKSVRIQLAGILKAVISMRLVRAAKGAGRVPAIEVLVSTAFIRDHIINEEKTYMIREAIAAGTSQYGMQTFDQSLFHLLQSRLITVEEALHNATNPDEFKMRVQGIYSADDTLTNMTTPATLTSATPKISSPTIRTEPDSIFVKH